MGTHYDNIVWGTNQQKGAPPSLESAKRLER